MIKFISRGACLAIGSMVALGFPGLVALAEYKPPSDLGRGGRSEGSGSRGCQNSADVALHLVAPNNKEGSTAKAHPTFLVHVSAPTLLRFALVEPGVTSPIVDRQLPVSQSGFVPITLPTDTPGLEVGKNYRWSASVVCNPLRPSENKRAIAWVRRVDDRLTSEVKGANTDRQRAEIYAQAGVWYDAVATSFIVRNSNPQDSLFPSLLEQAGLIKEEFRRRS